MDSVKDGNQTIPGTPQEVFTGQDQNVEPPVEPVQPEYTPAESDGNYQQEEGGGQSPDIYGNYNPSAEGEGGGNEAPPYYEDNKKKLILPVVGILVFIILLLLAMKLINRPKAPKTITLNYWGLWEDAQVMRGVIDDYTKTNPNVKINYQKQSPKEYRERLQAAIGRGDGPDIFRFHNTWLPMLQSVVAPVPPTVMTSADFEKTFYPVTKNDLKIGDSYYGIPLEIDGLVLLYNDDILKSAGVSPPTNWEELRNAALKTTVKDKTTNRLVTAGVALGTGDNIEHFSDILALMMLQNGADLKDLTKAESVEALTFYRKFAESPTNTWDDTLENSIVAFAGGKVAMIFVPTWQIPAIREMNPSLNFKVTTVPQLPGVNINWASYWVEGVSQKSANTLTAFNFLKYLSSREVMIKLYTEEAKYRQVFGEPYSRVDLSSTLASDPYLGPLIAEAPNMRSFPLSSRTFDNGLNDQLIKYLLDGVNSLSQGASPQSAMEVANRGFKQILGKYGLVAAPVPTQ